MTQPQPSEPDLLQLKWQYGIMGTSIGQAGLLNLDLDGDGSQEIVASCSGAGRLLVYDGVSHDLQMLIEHPSRALEVADVDGNGSNELLVGRNDGKVDVFSGTTLALERTVNTSSTAAVDALQVIDLEGDGSSSGWPPAVVCWPSSTGQEALRWKSGDLSANLGWYNHIGVKDCDGDGKKEIYLGADLGLYQFK